MSVVIETTLGDVTVDLFIQERPQTCLNFLKLCKIKYYNLCLFHNVTSNFMAQTGDPTGKGDGGESIFGILKGRHNRLYQGEKLPKIKHDRTGLLSMVSHGEGLLGSQFIITLSGDLTSLDGEHVVFGQIVEGDELLLKLNEAITDDQHRPYQDIRITHTVILEDPFPDPDGLEVPPLSPVPPNPLDVAYSRIPADEALTENYSQEELDEIVAQREAAARAAILEMVGDIPDAEAAPPENVLFVCKLNPVTTDHDLSIIFSRFGTVKSCEVIRDQITGDSLQYAFVEFEDRKACEDAYFKMDNVLIDDRRIHVDFSQSVAKLKWKGKGRGVEHLGPPPPGGWGNRDGRRDNKRRQDDSVKNFNDNFKKRIRYEDRRANYEPNYVKNGKPINDRQFNNRKIKPEEKREGKKREKLKRKKSTSSSSSSESSSESTSSSESSESSYHKKKKSKSSSRKVLVVVKTPRRSKTHKKPKKVRNKSKKYKSDSDSDDSTSDIPKKKKRKTRKKSSSSEESSSDEVEKKRKKRKRSTSSEDEPKSKRKKKKQKESDSGESSSEDDKKKNKSKKRKVNDTSSDSESDRVKKRKKDKLKNKKKKVVKKPKKRHRKESESTSSSD